MADKPLPPPPSDADIEKMIDRCYEHPNVSPWHVREALQMMHLRIKHLEKQKKS
jgi:hypothetical protein